MQNGKKAVVLLSGGLDSATVLAMAKAEGFSPYALSFAYGQRHKHELLSAARIARVMGVAEHRVIALDMGGIGGSALTDGKIAVPKARAMEEMGQGIPATYVPARNTVFLSLALAWAEVLGAHDIFIGVNAMDFSGYPDCRPEFIRAFEAMANVATAHAVKGNGLVHIHAPLISMTKADIIRAGMKLGVDYALTSSCYDPGPQGEPCGSCDACQLRRKGFAETGVADPVL